MSNFSKMVGINVESHSEIEFVDIFVVPDTPLFIDPYLILYGNDRWAMKAQKQVSNYFENFFDIYNQRLEKDRLFEHAHEIQITKLGYGKGDRGAGKTKDGMIKALEPLEKLIDEGIRIESIYDVNILVKRYGKDSLSDLMTNVISNVLYEFTLEISRKYGIGELSDKSSEYYYWSEITNGWVKTMQKNIVFNGKKILLVPKTFVAEEYPYSTENFFRRVLARKYPDYINKSKTIKDIIEEEKKKDLYIVTANKIIENLGKLTDYNEMIIEKYKNNGRCLTNEKLDNILYTKN